MPTALSFVGNNLTSDYPLPSQESEHLCEETCIELFTARLGAAVAEAETNPEGKKKEMKYILVPVETSHLLWGRESGLCSLTWKRCP